MYNLYKEYLEYFDLLDNQILLRSRDRKLEEANKKYENLINETKESIIRYSQLKFHEDISSSINTLSKYQIFDLLDHLYDFKEFEELKKQCDFPQYFSLYVTLYLGEYGNKENGGGCAPPEHSCAERRNERGAQSLPDLRSGGCRCSAQRGTPCRRV